MLLLLSALGAVSASAGHYAVTYTGGTVTVTTPHFTTTRNYAVNPVTGYYGGAGSTSEPPPGGGPAPVGQGGSVVCIGVIEAKFTWVPTGGADLEPPKNVVLKVEGLANWTGTSGDCGNGINSQKVASAESGSSFATETFIKVSGASFTVVYAPYAWANFQPGETGVLSGTAFAGLKVSATPIVISPLGTINDDGHPACLKGQRTRFVVTAGSYTLSDHSWSNLLWTISDVVFGASGSSGPNGEWSYRLFRRTDSVPGATYALESPDWIYDNSAREDDLIRCSVNVYDGSTLIGSAQAERELTAYVPYFGWAANAYPPSSYDASPPGYVYSGSSPGDYAIEFTGAVGTPLLFVAAQGYGSWASVQKVSIDRYQWYQAPGLIQSYDSTVTPGFVLDNSYPYQPDNGPWWPAESVAGSGSYFYVHDAPEQELPFWTIEFMIRDQFQMYQAWMPPNNGIGRAALPVAQIDWRWDAHGPSPWIPFWAAPEGAGPHVTGARTHPPSSAMDWQDVYGNVE